MTDNITAIKVLLEAEVRGDIETAWKFMHPDYSMTWVEQGADGALFPCVSGDELKRQMPEIYKIRGREYQIKNILGSDNVVMAEIVESYPDPETGQVYRTPMCLVWEFENGKVKTGRHYCDPKLSYLNLTQEQIEKMYMRGDGSFSGWLKIY